MALGHIGSKMDTPTRLNAPLDGNVIERHCLSSANPVTLPVVFSQNPALLGFMCPEARVVDRYLQNKNLLSAKKKLCSNLVENLQNYAHLRGQTKGSKIRGKMGTKWSSRDGPKGHQRTASRCNLPQ